MLKRIIPALMRRASKLTGGVYHTNADWQELLTQREKLVKSYVEHVSHRFDPKRPCTGLVFSFNRPVQLHALLTSYLEKAKNPVPLIVQYGASEPKFAKVYKQIEAEFGGDLIEFRREKNFRDEFFKTMTTFPSEKMFFLVDDLMFIDDVDMKHFASFNPLEVMPSLRLAPHLRFCYTRQMKQLPPKLKPYSKDKKMLTWNWGDAGNEWNYPWSHDGNLFNTAEIEAMTIAGTFGKAPNTHEVAMQMFRELAKGRPGLCYQRSKLLNIPCNKVQTVNKNVAGLEIEMSPDELIERWENGEMIDPSAHYGFVNTGPHQEVPFRFIKRPVKTKKAAPKKKAAPTKKAVKKKTAAKKR